MLSVFMAILGIACVAYGLFVRAAGSGTGFFLVWIALGAAFALLALIFSPKLGIWSAFPKILRRVLIITAALGITAFSLCELRISGGFGERAPGGADYLLILGAQVHESGPSLVLRYRLDSAYEYLAENENTLCIVSGGKGENEPRPEAQIMKEYLVERGVSPERILLEESSKNTIENIRNSMALFDPSRDSVAIVTNDFHLYRALAIAKKQGVERLHGIAAPSSRPYLPNNLLREFVGVSKDVLMGNMKI